MPCIVISFEGNNSNIAEYDNLLLAYLQVYVQYESAHFYVLYYITYTLGACLECGLCLLLRLTSLVSLALHGINMHHVFSQPITFILSLHRSYAAIN